VVTFNVEELRRVVGSVNTMVGNNEVRSLYFSSGKYRYSAGSVFTRKKYLP
jgi:hypothetical protein